MNWFRRKPAPVISVEDRARYHQMMEAAWQRDNPLKVYRVPFMDDRHPVEIRARRHMLIDDEYVFRNPGSRSEALCGWHYRCLWSPSSLSATSERSKWPMSTKLTISSNGAGEPRVTFVAEGDYEVFRQAYYLACGPVERRPGAADLPVSAPTLGASAFRGTPQTGHRRQGRQARAAQEGGEGSVKQTRDPVGLRVAETVLKIASMWHYTDGAGDLRRIAADILHHDPSDIWNGTPCPLCRRIHCDPDCPLRGCRVNQKWSDE